MTEVSIRTNPAQRRAAGAVSAARPRRERRLDGVCRQPAGWPADRRRFENLATFSLLVGFAVMMYLDATLG
jgi:hypothetical protein